MGLLGTKYLNYLKNLKKILIIFLQRPPPSRSFIVFNIKILLKYILYILKLVLVFFLVFNNQLNF